MLYEEKDVRIGQSILGKLNGFGRAGEMGCGVEDVSIEDGEGACQGFAGADGEAGLATDIGGGVGDGIDVVCVCDEEGASAVELLRNDDEA